MLRLTTLVFCAFAACSAGTAYGDEALVAVAASFVAPMNAVAAAIEADTEHAVTVVSGSTGGLYAQIVHGAPFDVFVAADAERPRLLEESGHGLLGTRATVALGKLVLFSTDAELIRASGLDALRRDSVGRIAIANPRVAPYGVAAQQTLAALDLWQTLQPKLVRGESVAQTYAMTATANAELGLVALSQVVAAGDNAFHVTVPEELYAPIRQDMIVLAKARNNAAALAVHDLLRSARGRALIASFGYGLPAESAE